MDDVKIHPLSSLSESHELSVSYVDGDAAVGFSRAEKGCAVVCLVEGSGK